MEKSEKRERIGKFGFALFLTATPLLAAALFCLKDGKMIWDVYLPQGGWSDEITYYKQIEGILSHGMPRGYFGYNQSRALYGTLGVWGLIPLLPYCLWGVLFGWNYVSPIYANIFFCASALLLVCLMIRLKRSRMIFFSFFWFANQFLNRYLLSGVIEASVTSQLLLVTAMGYGMLADAGGGNGESPSKISDTALLAASTVLICFLSLGRPYYEVLFLIPFWKACKDKRRVWQAVLPALALVTLVLFFVNSHYFCSTYFSSMISLSGMWERGFLGILARLFSGLVEIARLMWYAVRYKGVGVGWYYLLLAVELFAMAALCVCRRICHKRVPPMFLITLLGDGLIVWSIIELYDLGVGARHILALVTANALLLALESRLPVNALTALICLASIIQTGDADAPPYRDEHYARYMEELREEFAKVVHVSERISYDNVVAMPTADTSAQDPGEGVCTYYGLLFAMPAGVGISLDFEDYYDQPENIKAGYILVHPQGLIRKKLEAMEMVCVYENQELALYAR